MGLPFSGLNSLFSSCAFSALIILPPCCVWIRLPKPAQVNWDLDLTSFWTYLQASGSNSTTRCWRVCHPWRSHKSWRVAWCTAHTYPGKWHWSLSGPAEGHSSYPTCWTSSPGSPCRWAGCWCQTLREKCTSLPPSVILDFATLNLQLSAIRRAPSNCCLAWIVSVAC